MFVMSSVCTSIQKSAELMAEIAQLCMFVPAVTATSIELTSFAIEEVKQHIQQLSEQFRNLTNRFVEL